MDRIIISGLRLQTIIGIHPHEQADAQVLMIHLEALISPDETRSAAQADDIDYCILDYACVREHIIDFAKQKRFQLVESFAHHLAESLLQRFSMASLQLQVLKPDAFDDTDGCGICIQRDR